MRILVDTSVWSLAFRRNNSPLRAVAELRELIREARVVMIGPIRQEVLSGIRKPEHYERLRDKLRAFPDWGVESGDYEKAAEFFKRCRSKGIQGSNTDFLACAIAHRSKFSILATDQDFEGYARHLPIQLHFPRPSLAEPDHLHALDSRSGAAVLGKEASLEPRSRVGLRCCGFSARMKPSPAPDSTCGRKL